MNSDQNTFHLERFYGCRACEGRMQLNQYVLVIWPVTVCLAINRCKLFILEDLCVNFTFPKHHNFLKYNFLDKTWGECLQCFFPIFFSVFLLFLTSKSVL